MSDSAGSKSTFDEMPFFSVIIPVYNGEHYLEGCLASVESQSFGDWECICIDDGSSDVSGKILDNAVRTDRRIRVVHQRNGGVSRARNRALDRVGAYYVCFLDGDDCFVPDAFSVLADCCRLKNPDAVEIRWSRSGTTVEAEAVSVRFHRLPAGAWEERWAWEFFRSCWMHVWRREVLGTNRFVEGLPLGEDVLFSLSVAPAVRSVAELNVPLYIYRDNEESAVHRKMTVARCRLFWEAFALIVDRLRHDDWRRHGVPFSVWRHLGQKFWFTDAFWFWRMPISEIREGLGDWLRQVCAYNAVFPYARYKQVIIRLVSLFPSALLAKFLVYNTMRLRRFCLRR